MKIPRLILVFFASLAAVTTMACERRSGTPQSTTGEIVVGMYGSLTGDGASFGQSSVEGAQLAVEEINAAGGVLGGRKIRLLVEDDQSRPEEASSAVTKLITQDKVVAVLGEVASRRTLAAAPVAQKYQIPMITPASTNERVTQVGDYIFRVCFIDPFQGEVLAKFAYNDLKARTCCRAERHSAGLLRRPHRFDSEDLHRARREGASIRSATARATPISAPSSRRCARRSPTRSSPPATTPKPPSSCVRRESSA